MMVFRLVSIIIYFKIIKEARQGSGARPRLAIGICRQPPVTLQKESSCVFRGCSHVSSIRWKNNLINPRTSSSLAGACFIVDGQRHATSAAMKCKSSWTYIPSINNRYHLLSFLLLLFPWGMRYTSIFLYCQPLRLLVWTTKRLMRLRNDTAALRDVMFSHNWAATKSRRS